jgi:3-hydroxyisobutyrate dehydrogenase
MNAPVIGFVGVGTMGAPMVRNLRKHGYPCVTYVRKKEIEEAMTAIGCKTVSDLQELASSVDIVLLCLPNDQIVEDVVAGEGGLLSALRPDSVIVDHSTVSPYTTRKLQELAGRQGVHYFDAPISGGPMGAEAGTLAIMVGGDERQFPRIQPVLQAMGKHIFYLGPHGAGNVAKLVNNLVIAVTELGLVEGFVMGAKMGIDPTKLYEVLAVSTGNSAMLHRLIPDCILTGNFEPKFKIDLLHKDVKLANDIGRNEQIRMLSGALAEQVFQEARAFGYGDLDISALILPLEQQAKVEVRKTRSNETRTES